MRTTTVMFTQFGHGAGRVAVALPSDAVAVMLRPLVELPPTTVPVKVGPGGAVRVPDALVVVVDGFDPLLVGGGGEVVNMPVMLVSLKFSENATLFDFRELKRIK